ncbi:extracellular response kinase [Pelomyxa schiedti]|nr:extracellular response kinase [Pelomyxa schiedti]
MAAQPPAQGGGGGKPVDKTEEVDKHILKRYEIQQRLGKGAYGVVWKAMDRVRNEKVALKKIFDAFQNQTDAQRTYREIVFLQQLGGHENIIRLLDVHKAENDKDIYLVFEFMETDLHAVIRAGILEDIHKQYTVYQLVKALKWIHSAGVIHRDIKPSNLLLNSECLVKVADFGLARSVDSAGLTDYVATRWYRAPEILLGSSKYTAGIDMWSVGCILGELIGAKPMFPGTSTMNQVDRVLEVTGRPTHEDIEVINSPYANHMLEQLPPSVKKNLSDSYPQATEEAIDLMERLLQFNPLKRPTAEEALEHPYLVQFHNPDEEPGCPHAAEIQLADSKKFTVEEYRNRLYQDILRKKKAAHATATGTSTSTATATPAAAAPPTTSPPPASSSTTTASSASTSTKGGSRRS